MVEVIETNIFVDNDNRIYDHQSRIIEVEDWDTYCNAFELYDGRAICFKSKQMPGNSIQANRKIKELHTRSRKHREQLMLNHMTTSWTSFSISLNIYLCVEFW